MTNTNAGRFGKNVQTISLIIFGTGFLACLQQISPLLANAVRVNQERQIAIEKRLDTAIERIETLENKIAYLEANQCCTGDETDTATVSDKLSTSQPTIKSGDSMQTVRDTLGEPWRKTATVTGEAWYYDLAKSSHGYQYINFDNKVVNGFTMIRVETSAK
ncbi:MAG: hypothetical protein H7Y38_00360 [Armatimonadetes bacterium]|nr:hypothetical protein [Armatimonadota bacterium]